MLGKIRNGSNEKAKRLLGWTPRSSEEAIVATAERLVRFRLLKKESQRILFAASCATSEAAR
jgi:dihydroflavonol-4-reductase